MNVRPDQVAFSSTSGRLARLTSRARQALLIERIWRAATPALVVVAVFLTVSWLGLWSGLAPWARIAGVALVAALFLASLWPFAKLVRPTSPETMARVDADSKLAHRPAATLSDRQALGPDDPDSRLLWALHQKRAAAALQAARAAAPRAGLAQRDPWALRIVALMAAAGAAIVAGPDWRSRLMQPFDWTTPVAPVAGSRIDGWIDPPAYTRVAPTILTIAAGEAARTVKAPINSTLVIRAAGASDLAIATSGGLNAVESDKKPADGSIERRWIIAEPGVVEVKRGQQILARLSLEPIPDQAPTISMTQPPQGNARGSLTLNYKVEDDYGVASGEAIFERAQPPATRRAPRPLVQPPRMTLALPAEPRGVGDGQSILDLSAHPWAGARVKMTLTIKDEANQEGKSEPVELNLPQRPFTKPVAKALVELRRTLVLDANTKPRVLSSLDAMMLNPERFTPETSIFLGLKTAYARLRIARKDAELIDVADYLWDMAVQIEDGDLSQSERDLRAAQEALRQALERGASDEEIKRLTQDLRAALDKFMRELAEQMRRDGQQQQADNQRTDPNMRTMRPEDFKRMIDRMEQMARQGARDEARKMLDDLQRMLENLQTARPNQRGGQDPLAREMNRALDELDKMVRDQQALRDETFRQGQDQRGRQRADRNRQQQQQGQRGQRGQRGQQGQQQPGQQGEQGDQGDQESAENGEGQQGGGQTLAERQQRLRERLEELRRRMRGLGMNGQQMQEAEEAMRDAEGQLGQGREGQAADAQGRALDALRRGAQNLAQQMMDGLGDPNGEQADATDNDSPGNAPQNRRAGAPDNDDPLGRPTRSRDAQDNSRVKVPRPGESASERAQQVLEELRRRLGDTSRSSEEIDYLRRLLSPY